MEIFKNYPIWKLIFKPRVTTRDLLRGQRYPSFLPTILLMSIFGSLYLQSEYDETWTGSLNFAQKLGIYFVIALIVYLIYMVIEVELNTFWGNHVGGTGNRKMIRSAWVWGQAPRLVIFPIFICLIYLIAYREGGNSTILESSAFNWVMIIFVLLLLPMILYMALFPLLVLAEAHKFSLWRALSVDFLSGVSMTLGAVLLIMLVRTLRHLL